MTKKSTEKCCDCGAAPKRLKHWHHYLHDARLHLYHQMAGNSRATTGLLCGTCHMKLYRYEQHLFTPCRNESESSNNESKNNRRTRKLLPYNRSMNKSTKSNRLAQLSLEIQRLSNGGDIDEMMSDWSTTEFARQNASHFQYIELSTTLLNNCVDFMNSLSSQSHFRRPLIQLLFRNIKQSEVAALCGVSTATVSQAQRTSTDELFSRTGVQSRTRKRVDDAEIELICQSLSDSCPVVSGKTHRKQSNSNEQLYDSYLQFMGRHPEHQVRSENYVLSFRKALGVRREKRYLGHFRIV